jgi:hypothetical protein
MTVSPSGTFSRKKAARVPRAPEGAPAPCGHSGTARGNAGTSSASETAFEPEPTLLHLKRARLDLTDLAHAERDEHVGRVLGLHHEAHQPGVADQRDDLHALDIAPRDRGWNRRGQEREGECDDRGAHRRGY